MNVFLVHGSFGKPFENWFPWLEGKLSEKKINCVIPSFPTPEHQNYTDWEMLMDYYVDLGTINEDTVLIGHSCGALFIAKYLSTHAIKVKGVIFVSGYTRFVSDYPLMDALNDSFYVDNASMNVRPFANSIVAYYGDDDPNIPQEKLREFAEATGAESKCIHNAGHFNASAGFFEFVDVLETIMKLDEQ